MSFFETARVNELVDKLKPAAAKIENDFSRGVAIYGAGVVGTWAASYLKSIGAKVILFLDKDPAKKGSIDGIPVEHPFERAEPLPKSIFIAARHAVSEVEKSLVDSGATMLSFDAYFVVRNYERLTKIRDDAFADEKSVEVFNGVLYAMLTSTLDSCRATLDKDMYFGLPQFSGTFEDIFVDAGAFVGDSVECFIWENLGTFRHIYAFEPGHRQFAAMEHRMERLSKEWAFPKDRVTLVQGGLSDKPGEMSFTFVEDFPIRHGLVSQESDNSNKGKGTIPVYTLDQYLAGKPVTFLKADIEGMEMQFLHGAAETIKKYKPKMAICAYHYPSDLYEIIEYVRSIVPEYRFYMRNHAPIFGDFVIYCTLDK